MIKTYKLVRVPYLLSCEFWHCYGNIRENKINKWQTILDIFHLFSLLLTRTKIHFFLNTNVQGLIKRNFSHLSFIGEFLGEGSNRQIACYPILIKWYIYKIKYCLNQSIIIPSQYFLKTFFSITIYSKTSLNLCGSFEAS